MRFSTRLLRVCPRSPSPPVLRGRGVGVRGWVSRGFSPLTPNPTPLSTGERGACGTDSNFQIAKMIQAVDRQIDIFNYDFFSAVRQSRVIDRANLGESLIFIMGMPRSGTTLVEQILASHPSVHAGGERSDTSLIVEQTCAAANLPYPDTVRCLDRGNLDQLAELYLTRTRHDKEQNERFVDKSIIVTVHLVVSSEGAGRPLR
jgi:hypothetical protein